MPGREDRLQPPNLLKDFGDDEVATETLLSLNKSVLAPALRHVSQEQYKEPHSANHGLLLTKARALSDLSIPESYLKDIKQNFEHVYGAYLP